MRLCRLVLPSAFVAALASATLVAGPAASGVFAETTGFGSNPGNLRMFTYVPDDLRDPAPLVVVMHGCNQTAAEYLDQSGWREAADAGRFAMVLPEQQVGAGPWTFSGRNHPTRCLNFAERRDSIRDGGEAHSIRQMVGHAAGRLGADPDRIFVTGLSAGGGMTAVMLATYPDVFAAGSIVAGLPYRCGEATLTAPAACGVTLQGQPRNRAPDRSPADWGARVRAAAPAGFVGPWPRVSIWQGEADGTVDPPNATELVEQWTNVHGIDAVPDLEEQVRPARRAAFADAAGRTRVELHRIPSFGHATPIDPDAAEPCGRTGAFVRDADICSTVAIARFFGLEGSPPTVTIDSVRVEVDAIVVAGAAADGDGPLVEVVVRLDGPSPQPARPAVGAESWTARFEVLPPNRFYRPVAVVVDGDGEIATAAAAPVAVGTPAPNGPPEVAVLEARAEGVCLRVSGHAADPDGIAEVLVRLRNAGCGRGCARRRGIRYGNLQPAERLLPDRGRRDRHARCRGDGGRPHRGSRRRPRRG